MTSDELYALFRKDVVDTVEPYLWSDEEVYAYMNDAYYMFVRLTGGVPDNSSTVTNVTATQGQKFSAISPKILNIRMASLDPSGEVVKVINAQDVEGLNDEDYGFLRRVNMSTSVGKVRYLVVGQQYGMVQWVNIPDRNYTVHLLVDRLPLKDITEGDQKFEDVQSQHHFHFLKWMRHLAYSKQDAETFNKVKSAEASAEFVSYCDLAKREKDRYKHKVRVVRYGGL